MNQQKVLILGGPGYFGRLLVDDLLRHADCQLLVASRRPVRSEKFETVAADLLKVRSLVAGKEKNGAVVCPGWSTVSALSGVLARIATAGMKTIDSIYIHMAPENRDARRTARILHGCLSLLGRSGRSWTKWSAVFQRAAIIAFCLHLLAGLSSMRFAVLLTVAAIGPDLAAQAIEIGVLPSLAYRAFSTNAAPELFLTLHRVAVMLSGYLANGLYSLTALILAWSTRRVYPAWVWTLGVATGIVGFMLSAAVLMDSAAGMFWTNVLLVPAILLWLAGVAISLPKSGSQSAR